MATSRKFPIQKLIKYDLKFIGALYEYLFMKNLSETKLGVVGGCLEAIRP